MKKIISLFMCFIFCASISACTSKTHNEFSENTENITEQQKIPEFDCFQTNSTLLNKYLKLNDPAGKIKLKTYELSTFFIYKELPYIDFPEEINKREHVYLRYVVDNPGNNSSVYSIKVDSALNEDNLQKVTGQMSHPDWDLVYEYLCDPGKVFREECEIYNVYCLNASDSYYHCLTQKDIFIYFETQLGDFLLYQPFEYEPIDSQKPRYESKNKKESGYSNVCYLIPKEKIYTVWETITKDNKEFSEGSPMMAKYYGETQMHRIIDLEPYKFVPGQLPQ